MEYDYASHEWKRVVLQCFDEFLTERCNMIIYF